MSLAPKRKKGKSKHKLLLLKLDIPVAFFNKEGEKRKKKKLHFFFFSSHQINLWMKLSHFYEACLQKYFAHRLHYTSEKTRAYYFKSLN